MAASSCVIHPAKNRLIILRKWQLEFCGAKNQCAALLLSFFEHWHNVKLESRAKSLWQDHTNSQLEDGIMVYKRDTIASGIEFLESRGVIELRVENASVNEGLAKVWNVLFMPEVVNEWIFKKYGKPSENSEPPSENSEGPSEKSEGGPSEKSSPPKILSTTMIPLTPKDSERSEDSTLEEEKQGNEIDFGMDVFQWCKQAWNRIRKTKGLDPFNALEKFKKSWEDAEQAIGPREMREAWRVNLAQENPQTAVEFIKGIWKYPGGLAKHVPESRGRRGLRVQETEDEQYQAYLRALGKE